MKTSHGLEYAAIWTLTKFVQIIPGRIADWMAVGLGKLTHLILASRRRIALENLKRSNLGITDEERLKEIVTKVFINIARTTIEFCRQPVYTSERILQMYSGTEGMEYLEKTQQDGTGAMLISGHLGNWELLGGWLKASGYQIDFLVGKQHNQKVDDLFVSFRRSLGVGIIPVGVAARRVIKALREGRFVAVVSDQHAASGGIVVDFFGRKASTPAGPAAFAVKVGCPILCGGSIRLGYNKHRAIIMPPIYPPNSGDIEKDIKAMTQVYSTQFETLIRKYPEQWMWTHRRWKID